MDGIDAKVAVGMGVSGEVVDASGTQETTTIASKIMSSIFIFISLLHANRLAKILLNQVHRIFNTSLGLDFLTESRCR